jgi:hypothetical protein
MMEWGYRLPRDYCCEAPERCMTTGSLQQIETLLGYYGHLSSSIKGPPPKPKVIYDALTNDDLIIAAIGTSPMSGHVVIVRGIRLVDRTDGLVAELLLNDPMQPRPRAVSYDEFRRMWQQAIVIHRESGDAE